MVIYSHSKLSTFEQCQLKFKFQYIDKLKPEFEETIEEFLGHKIHKTLEWLYKQVSQKIIPQLDQVIHYYIADWNKDFNKEIKIIKQELNPEHYFNQGVKFLVNYFQTNHPFKDNTIETEKRIFTSLDKQGKYQLQGYIDRIVHNKESNIFEIHDYKTGGFLKSQQELDNDRQLALYSIGIRDLFENVKDVHLIWHFLAFNEKRISKRTDEQLEKLKQEIIQLIDKIESTKDFSPNPSKLCKWCEFRTYCHLFNGHNEINNLSKDNEINKQADSNSWSLYEGKKELNPLVFSNGKSQADIVEEVISAINQGNKIIFIHGMCGTGKSAIALNLARILGKASIVVPIKSLQKQYTEDYSEKKYVLHNGRKLTISPIVGRKNFKCKYLEENQAPGEQTKKYPRETNTTLTEIFSGKPLKKEKDKSCDNNFLPCKIEIKEKNIDEIKNYIKKNPLVKFFNFNSVHEIKRMTIAPICEYWSPIISDEFDIRIFKNSRKIKYQGLNNKQFTFYQRKKGCGYYDQYEAYADADVLIFNSLKYKLETLMDRKPFTEIEIIDECDDFLDSFANQEKINLNRLLFSLTSIFTDNIKIQEAIDELIDLVNAIKIKYTKKTQGVLDKEFAEIFNIKKTLIEELLKTTLENLNLIESIEIEESNYLFHLDEVARIFEDFFDETFFSIEKTERDLIIHLVTPNLAKRLRELVEKNKILVMMSGTIHSEYILKNVFGLENFKIIEAETQHQGELIKCRNGYEINCRYENFKSGKITREQYLLSLSKAVACAKLPALVHLTGFSDLPTQLEKEKFLINNLPISIDLINEQEKDPLGKRVMDFKKGKIPVLFTTKCSRGIDFPGKTCNSIIITRFPYPNISSIFWRILKKTKPEHYRSFYMDKANRELLQRIYRGLRSKQDKIYLLSPDSRVLDFDIN